MRVYGWFIYIYMYTYVWMAQGEIGLTITGLLSKKPSVLN